MKADTAIAGARQYGLRHALLVYGSGDASFVTVHDVRTRAKKAPTLGPGRPADVGFIRALAESVQQAVAPEVLPDYVLCRTPDVICWWSPAARQPMHFREKSELEALSGRVVHQPPLLWKLDGRALYVRALARNERPSATKRLCVAPYWNVDIDGRVCLGDMKRPERVSIDSLRGWEHGFFGSLFTGQNSPGAKYTKAKGGIIGLWRQVARARRFPMDSLVELKQTVADFVRGKGGDDDDDA